MKKTIMTIVTLFGFLVFSTQSEAETLYPINHTFKIKFNQPVSTSNLKNFITLQNAEEKELYKYAYVDAENSKLVYVQTGSLQYDQQYTLIINENLQNKRGKRLKEGKTFTFKTEKNPYYYYSKNLAPVSATFKNYADTYLTHTQKLHADYYYSDVITENLVEQYNTFYEEEMLLYMQRHFPLTKNHVENPTFIFLGNEIEPSTIQFAENFYGKSAIPFGWFTPSHNITIMTQRNYTAPYQNINTILFPHEYFHWVNRNVYKSSIPTWLNEGIAYNLSWSMYYKTDNFMESSLYDKYKNILANDPYISIQDSNVYMVVTAYIQGMYGQEKLEKLVKTSTSKSFDEAFIEIYGKTVQQMLDETRHYIESHQ